MRAMAEIPPVSEFGPGKTANFAPLITFFQEKWPFFSRYG
jgi:hypothetical protein